MNRRAFFIFSLGVLVGVCLAARAWAAHRNTDIRIDTVELGAISLNEKVVPREKNFRIPLQGDTALGINDDGDPYLGTSY